MIVWSACGNAARSCRRLHASRTVKKRAASQGRPKTTLSRSDMFCTHGTCAQKAIPSAGSGGTPWQWVRASPSRPASSEDFPEATPPATSSSSPSLAAFHLDDAGLLSYATAVAEAVTISAFPCYRFADYAMAIGVGGFYYATYFLVSFPMYFSLFGGGAGAATPTLGRAVVEALATGMAVLLILDLCRVGIVGKDFHMRQLRPCKVDPSRACAPFLAC